MGYGELASAAGLTAGVEGARRGGQEELELCLDGLTSEKAGRQQVLAEGRTHWGPVDARSASERLKGLRFQTLKWCRHYVGSSDLPVTQRHFQNELLVTCVAVCSSLILGSTPSAVSLLSSGLGHLGYLPFPTISHAPVPVPGHSRTQASVAGSEIPGSWGRFRQFVLTGRFSACCTSPGATPPIVVTEQHLAGPWGPFPSSFCHTCFPEQMCVSVTDVFRSTSAGRVAGATQAFHRISNST